MQRSLVFMLVGSLLVVLLAGCVESGFAGQDDAGAPAVTQSTTAITPSPEVVGPTEQNATSPAAGEAPSIVGNTPEAGQVGAWQHHRFFDGWDVGYPANWTVNMIQLA